MVLKLHAEDKKSKEAVIISLTCPTLRASRGRGSNERNPHEAYFDYKIVVLSPRRCPRVSPADFIEKKSLPFK